MLEHFSPRTLAVIESAHNEARLRGCEYVDLDHIIIGLEREGDDETIQALNHSGFSLETQAVKIIDFQYQSRRGSFSNQAFQALEIATNQAITRSEVVEPHHVLYGIKKVSHQVR